MKGFEIRGAKMGSSAKEYLFEEMYTLFSAGLDYSRSFELLMDGEKDRKRKIMLESIFSDINNGHSLHRAMADTQLFSDLDHGVVQIGEQTGKLSYSLHYLANFYRKKNEQTRIVKNALTYPAVILFTAIAVVIFMLTVVVPMFEEVYDRMGGEIPWLTQFIIDLAAGHKIILLPPIVLAILLWLVHRNNKNNPTYRIRTSSLVLCLPITGKIMKMRNQAVICNLLSLMLSSGVTLFDSLNLTAHVINSYSYKESITKTMEIIRNGGTLSHAMSQYPRLYDRKLTAMVSMGEETGQLAAIFQNQGERLTRGLEDNIKQAGTLMEPIMIILIGSVVAVILVAMYLPMFKLGSVGM